MRKQSPNMDLWSTCRKAVGTLQNSRVGVAALLPMLCLVALALPTPHLQAVTNAAAASTATADPAGGTVSLAASLGVHFIPGSSSTVLIARDGKTYLVDLDNRTIQEQEKDSPSPSSAGTLPHLTAAHSSPQDVSVGAKVFADNCAGCHGAGGKGGGALKTPDFTNPGVQAALSDSVVAKTIRGGKPGTAMPAWSGKLSEDEINAVAAFVRGLGQTKKPEQGAPGAEVKQAAKVYTPADDYLFSLPTGRRLDRHGLYLNFTHRFPYTPAFSGSGGGDTLFGLDDYAVPSFGLRFGVTDKLSVSAYRSPSLIDRPIELGVAYNFLDEHEGNPLNAAARVSLDGQNDFSKNFTTNFEMMLSRTITRHSQFYLVPTVSLQQRELISKPRSLASVPPNLPGFNTFVLAAGGALDIRPTVALVTEVFPTLVNGPELGIHRPAYAFGIQKRVLHHAFTLGFSNSPGTVVTQRAGTRATFLGQPSSDTPSGLFIGFDLMRQIY
jgi:mono/diheme cytochrome c family protein